LFIQGPAIGCDHTVRSLVTSADGAEQGRMKPSAVLVAAFEVKVGGPGKIGFVAEHGGMAATRFEPNVENVSFFGKFCSPALGALCVRGNQGIGVGRVPGVSTCAREELDYFSVKRGIVQG